MAESHAPKPPRPRQPAVPTPAPRPLDRIQGPVHATIHHNHGPHVAKGERAAYAPASASG